MITDNELATFEAFQDNLSTTVIARLSPTSGKGARKKAIKGRKNEIKPVTRVADNGEGDAAELEDFIEARSCRQDRYATTLTLTDDQFLAEEIFLSLPANLRTLSYATTQDEPELKETYSIPLDTALLETIVEHLPPTISDSLETYGLIKDPADLDKFLEPVLESYITATISPPSEYTPAITASRPDGCEICSREHLPLTYHHLIPRQMHAKAVKRGWHKEWELSKVAWLCRACHTYVHKILTNEELAKEWYNVELLVEREDVHKWAKWVGSVRWKAR
ncbi:hypothetical protein LTR62_003371 [Meristemomyces frigidus]|uniref:HNH domain-containing protein n=1 Tax=Meristemomyces frigidus TaxID=1508187 RepID=A0AAN7TG94_9PEZI|nr:hypothetical protein LTR62_003371 [Meristemomyces frigidus]